MAKVFYDSDKINTKIINNLDSTVRNLTKAKEMVRSLDVPDFSYKSYLNSIPGLLNENIDDCNNAKASLEGSVTRFTNYIDESNSELNKCVAYDLMSKDVEVK